MSELPHANPRFNKQLAVEIARNFVVGEPISVTDFENKGNINHDTFLVRCADQSYLLQRLNHEVFRRPRSVMEAMTACLEAQTTALEKQPHLQGVWKPIQLAASTRGLTYHLHSNGHSETWWRMMGLIPQTVSYKSLGDLSNSVQRVRLAAEAGRGLAIYGDLTSGMDIARLVDPLPGYRNTELYFSQFDAIVNGLRTAQQCTGLLPENEEVRDATRHLFELHLPAAEAERRLDAPGVREAIALANSEREHGMLLHNLLKLGTIRRVAVHGDTKLENFLFCAVTGTVLSLVDLDTIMVHTWLSDWGDMARSLINVAGEKEADSLAIAVDLEIFSALVEGFLSAASTPTPHELRYVVAAVRVLALELGVRFLTDYLRGDNYFTPGPNDPDDINRIRGIAQLTLYRRLCDRRVEMESIVQRVLQVRGTAGLHDPEPYSVSGCKAT